MTLIHLFLSPNGMHSIYVLDFGRGHRVITHVTWTEERAAHHRGEQ